VFIDNDIIVTFEILDVAPLTGDVNNIVKETPLATAANKLVSLVKRNRFFISLQDPAFKQVSFYHASNQDWVLQQSPRRAPVFLPKTIKAVFGPVNFSVLLDIYVYINLN
jgi:hypothetical protein